jgi:D-xylose 1-dehydrogenase (NADP+, D-xylono-1,5-lactone-forming)
MASGSKLRWGILGVAKINERLLPAFAASQRGQLVGIASRSADKARAAANAAGIPKSHGSYDDLLADSEIDAVYIPLPNHLHDEWTRKAADQGKHVLCEKPLTPSARTAAALVEHCARKGVRLMDGFMWPHHPRAAELRRLIDAGIIGRVEYVHASFTFQLPMDASNIRLQPDAAGGSLLDVGCYPVYGIRWAFGAEPARVFATAKFAHGVDASMSAILWFADGHIASFDCGFTLPLRQHMEITGSKGLITIPQMWLPDAQAGYDLQIDDKAERRTCPCPSQIVCMLDEFAACVQENRGPNPDARQAVATLRVLDALAKSARENRPIDV